MNPFFKDPKKPEESKAEILAAKALCATKIVNLEKVAKKEKLESVKNEVLTVSSLAVHPDIVVDSFLSLRLLSLKKSSVADCCFRLMPYNLVSVKCDSY